MISQHQELRTSGVLVVAHGAAEKRFVLIDGRVVFARSSDPDDRLGEQLLVQRKISLRQYREASLQIRQGRRLGAALVEMGAIKAEQLIDVLRTQIKAIIYGMFAWTDGDYWLEEADAGRDMAVLKSNTADIVMEGIHRVEAWSRIEAGLSGVRTRYRQAEGCDSKVARMTLSAENKSLLGLLTQPWDVASLCRVGEMPSIEVCRMLWAFRVIGAITQVD